MIYRSFINDTCVITGFMRSKYIAQTLNFYYMCICVHRILIGFYLFDFIAWYQGDPNLSIITTNMNVMDSESSGVAMRLIGKYSRN